MKGTGYKVFVVEDNEMFSMMIDQKLKSNFNAEVVTFGNAESCLRELHQEPSLIILDHFLEKMTGLEALQLIKQKNPDIPVILISGQNEIQVTIDAFNAGAFDYIIKNKDAPDRIVNSVQKIINMNSIKSENIELKLRVKKYKLWLLIALVLFLGLCIIAISTMIFNF